MIIKPKCEAADCFKYIKKVFPNSYLAEDNRQIIIGIDVVYFDSDTVLADFKQRINHIYMWSGHAVLASQKYSVDKYFGNFCSFHKQLYGMIFP